MFSAYRKDGLRDTLVTLAFAHWFLMPMADPAYEGQAEGALVEKLLPGFDDDQDRVGVLQREANELATDLWIVVAP